MHHAKQNKHTPRVDNCCQGEVPLIMGPVHGVLAQRTSRLTYTLFVKGIFHWITIKITYYQINLFIVQKLQNPQTNKTKR